jgi:hypothetical protein
MYTIFFYLIYGIMVDYKKYINEMNRKFFLFVIYGMVEHKILFLNAHFLIINFKC